LDQRIELGSELLARRAHTGLADCIGAGCRRPHDGPRGRDGPSPVECENVARLSIMRTLCFAQVLAWHADCSPRVIRAEPHGAERVRLARTIPAPTRTGQTAMTAIHETADPRIRSNLSDHALATLYTPPPDARVLLHRPTPSTVAVCGGVVLLKTLQRWGACPRMDTLPPRLIPHRATTMGVLMPDGLRPPEDPRRLRAWQGPLLRTHLGLTAFQEGGRHVRGDAVREAAQSTAMLADLLHVGRAALGQARSALPALSTRQRAAQTARAHVNSW
jgi:hypothetical protein